VQAERPLVDALGGIYIVIAGAFEGFVGRHVCFAYQFAVALTVGLKR
jgi:hypothetical protein